MKKIKTDYFMSLGDSKMTKIPLPTIGEILQEELMRIFRNS